MVIVLSEVDGAEDMAEKSGGAGSEWGRIMGPPRGTEPNIDSAQGTDRSRNSDDLTWAVISIQDQSRAGIDSDC